MKVCSNSSFTSCDSLARIGSAEMSFGPPARSSSQFADQEIFMSSPLMSDFGRATGVCSCAGALVRVS